MKRIPGLLLSLIGTGLILSLGKVSLAQWGLEIPGLALSALGVPPLSAGNQILDPALLSGLGAWLNYSPLSPVSALSPILEPLANRPLPPAGYLSDPFAFGVTALSPFALPPSSPYPPPALQSQPNNPFLYFSTGRLSNPYPAVNQGLVNPGYAYNPSYNPNLYNIPNLSNPNIYNSNPYNIPTNPNISNNRFSLPSSPYSSPLWYTGNYPSLAQPQVQQTPNWQTLNPNAGLGVPWANYAQFYIPYTQEQEEEQEEDTEESEESDTPNEVAGIWIGTWSPTFVSGQTGGSNSASINIAQAGNILSGVFFWVGHSLITSISASGVVKGDKVKMTGTSQDEEDEQTITFEGEVMGNTWTGEYMIMNEATAVIELGEFVVSRN